MGHLLAEARVEDEAAGGDDAVTAKLDALLERVREDPAAKQEYLDLLELMGDDARVAGYCKGLDGSLVLRGRAAISNCRDTSATTSFGAEQPRVPRRGNSLDQ